MDCSSSNDKCIKEINYLHFVIPNKDSLLESDLDGKTNLIENNLSIKKPNQLLNEYNLKNKYFTNNIIQYYEDDRPLSSLKSSQSSYYLSNKNHFYEEDNVRDTNEEFSDDYPQKNKKYINSELVNLANAPAPLRSNSILNDTKFKKDKNLNANKLNSLSSHNINNSNLSPNLNGDIKKLSQFWIKSRSRSSSPRSSFKSSRKSFNNKHKNKHQQLIDYNSNHTCNNNSSNSSHSNNFSNTNCSVQCLNDGYSHHEDNDQYCIINNQNLANKVAAEYIKENYGLLSSSELKKNLENNYLYLDGHNEEEPVFNAFDLKSLRYSFNRVLKRRGGLWSISPTNTLNDFHNNCGLSLRDRKKINDINSIKIINGKQIRNNSNQLEIIKTNNNNNNQNNNQESERKGLIPIMDLIGDGKKLYWWEVPLVNEIGLLDKLDAKERQLQEAHFELIASEASYLRSLNLLIKNFYMHTFLCDSNIIDARKKDDLFSNILQVVDVSRELLNELEDRWKKNVYISTFCDILYKYSVNYFHVYMQYCRFKKRQERTLRQLQDKPKFNNILKLLESDVKIQGLSLHSFLLLPVQRITRYPLLIEAILNRSNLNSEFYQIAQVCLKSCNEVVNLCNFAAKQYEDYEELIPKLKFSNVKCFPMLSTPRWLINISDIVKIKPELQSTTIIGSFRSPNWSKTNACLILLSDLILICKKKSDDIYMVIDFCNRNSIEIYDIQNKTSNNQKMWENFKYLIQIIFLCNYASKKVEFYFNFNSEIEKLNWLKLSSVIENKKIAKKKENLLNLFKTSNDEIIDKINSQNDSYYPHIEAKINSGQNVFENNKQNLVSEQKEDWSDGECTNEIFI